MALLAFLWSGCWHKWAATGHITNVYDGLSSVARDLPVYVKLRYRCDKCGRIRDFRA